MKDVTLFGYGILAFALAILASLFLALLTLSIVSWLKRWRYLKWGAPIAAVSIAGAAALVIAEPVRLLGDNEFPYLRNAPNETDIPGVYVLHPSYIGHLKDEGYSDLRTKIVVRDNGAFEITFMPHIWVSWIHKGYDSCVGTWKVEKKPGTAVYGVTLVTSGFSRESAYFADPYFQNRPAEQIFVGISDRTRLDRVR